MNRQELELAISELNRLLADPDNAEDKFQQWFEGHPVTFQTLGYRRVIAHPCLQVNNETFIPDFLVQRIDGLWEIFELKRPDTNVLRDMERRQVFYATFEQYHSQCREYASFFEDTVNREAFNLNNNLDVQKSLSSIIVAGRNNGIDKLKIHNQLFDRGLKVTHMTFDDVGDCLETQRANLYSKYEDKRGLSVHIALIPRKCEKADNYILDIGAHPDKNRISLFFDKSDRLTFRVIDAEGQPFLNRVPSDSNCNYDEICYYTFELAIAADYAVLNIEVNGRYFYDCILPNFELDSNIITYVLGSDVSGLEDSRMDVIEVALYGTTLSFTEKCQLRDYIFSRYPMGAVADNLLPTRVCYSDHKFMYSKDHPNFT